MFQLDKFLGREYVEGKQDCYDLMRRYYGEVWGISLPNLARPTRFWEDPHLDLYGIYHQFGFQPVFDEPFQIGDAVLMPIMAPMNTHAGAYVGDNQILHHMVGQLSTIDAFRPRWCNRVTVHLRHPKVQVEEAPQVQLHEVLDANILRDPKIQEALEREVASRSGTVRDH